MKEMKSSNKNRELSLRFASLAALGAASSLALLISAVSYPLSGLLLRPPMKRTSQQKWSRLIRFIERFGIEVEDIVFSSFDQTKLRGWWMEAAPGAPTVIILHGLTKNRTDVIRTALMLRRSGFNILVFDGRGHGDSEGRNITYGFYERRDVESVIEILVASKKIEKGQIGLAGESMGAAIALQVAAYNSCISAVWADSSFSSLMRIAQDCAHRATRLPVPVLSPLLWTIKKLANYRGRFNMESVAPVVLARAIRCPVFLVHGAADELIGSAHSESIYNALGGNKKIWIVEGARHTRSVCRAKLEYSECILSFFKEHLK
jgi:uncharacterized protein